MCVKKFQQHEETGFACPDKTTEKLQIQDQQVKLRLTTPSRVKISKILKNSTFST